MGCTACTEPQCLYNGDIYLFLSLCINIHRNKPVKLINYCVQDIQVYLCNLMLFCVLIKFTYSRIADNTIIV